MSTRARALQGRLRINPDEPTLPPQVVQEAPADEPAGVVPPEAPAPADDPPAPRRVRQAATPPAAVSALEDPAVRPGSKGYRSFYVDDGPYARFRAAMYWLARNPEVVAELGDNMSSAVEQYLDSTAADLEKRFNGGQVFDAPPASRRRKPR